MTGRRTTPPKFLIAGSDERARVITLSRNFGSQASIMAGLAHATGTHVAMIAANLQEPPDMIANFWRACQNGAEIALASRSTRGLLVSSATSPTGSCVGLPSVTVHGGQLGTRTR